MNVLSYNQNRHTLGDLIMDRSTLVAIQDHVKAALLLAEKADIIFLVYLLNMMVLDVSARTSGKIKQH